MSLDLLPNELILIILNNLDHVSAYHDHNHPCRYTLLNLYYVCKSFSWLRELSISALEEFEDDSSYATFDIFGRPRGLQLIYNKHAYSFEGLSGITYEQKDCYYGINPFAGSDVSKNYYIVTNIEKPLNCNEDVEGLLDPDDVVNFLSDTMRQCEKHDPEFYNWRGSYLLRLCLNKYYRKSY